MDNKRFYWIKLMTNFYESDERIDFLMSQSNGSDYVVLYQMLCLKTANNKGSLSTNIGEIIIPYDVDKIVRDCKYFKEDTVMVALELYKKLGLVYRETNGCLQITDFDKMVGSEAGNPNAQRQKRFRERQKQNKLNTVTPSVTISNEEYRDKSIEYRDKINKSIDNIKIASSEPSLSPSNPPQNTQTFIELNLIGGETYNVEESYVKEMQDLYTNVNVENELKKMKAWLINNPTKRKTRKGICRFINSWLAREQDRGRNYTPTKVEYTQDRSFYE